MSSPPPLFSLPFQLCSPFPPLQLPSWNGTEPWCQHDCFTMSEPASLTVSTLLLPLLEIPKEWQTWKCLPFIFIWYLVLVPNMNGYWILFPSQYWTQMSVICRGYILSKHYLSGFSISNQSTLAYASLCCAQDHVLCFPRDTAFNRTGPGSPQSPCYLKRQDTCRCLHKFINNSKIVVAGKEISSVKSSGKWTWWSFIS